MSLKILLNKKIENFIKEYPDFSETDANKKFLFFSINNLLKDFRLECDEMVDVLTDDTNDFGIDAICVFSAGEAIWEDDILAEKIGRESGVRIKIITVTREKGFSETALLKLKNGIECIFDFERELVGNPSFVKKSELIRKIWQYCFELGSANLIDIELIYVCQSDDEKINKKVAQLEQKIYSYFMQQGLESVKTNYIGLRTLYNIISTESYSKNLQFKDLANYAEPYNRKVEGFYGLVRLKDFLEFITNKDGIIVEKYFEGNVRDFYGVSKTVNQKIKETIESSEKMNFWCLNNGITIVCEEAGQKGKSVKVTNFHIVNGCQTAHVIYECCDLLREDEYGEILVKVIQTRDEVIFGEVIDATNSQTAVSPISLHSNDLIQKNLEEHFLKYDQFPLFYERRLNYYKRRNKPASRIVSMMKLFQAFYSVFEKKPSEARGRPTSSFVGTYDRVFSISFDYDAYLFSYLLFLRICTINRKILKKTTPTYVEFLILKYGQLHLARIAFSLIAETDEVINLKEKGNLFVKKKNALFRLMDDQKKIELANNKSVKILERSLKVFCKRNQIEPNYNIFKNDELDGDITMAVLKLFRK